MVLYSSLAFVAVGVPLAMIAIFLTRTESTRRDPKTPRSPSDPVEEIELLKYENAVLRSEQQRALSLGKVGERIRGELGNVVTSGTDEGDEAWGALMEATVLRDTLMSVCQDLQTALRHVQLQLGSGVPIPEHDRRRIDRGRDAESANGTRGPTR